MNTMLNSLEHIEKKQWVLKASDRCDKCSAEALVVITGLSGELMFCGHHYGKIMEDPKGYKAMMDFMISIMDEREKLNEDRPVGSI